MVVGMLISMIDTIDKVLEQKRSAPLSQDPLKWEHSTQTPGSVQWGPGTCPQHETIKFEVRQIPSSEIIECDRFLHVF